MPTPAQFNRLGEAQRRQIEAEELALAQAQAALQAEQERLLAAQHYRQELREVLKPRPAWWRWRWLLPALPLLLAGGFSVLRPAPPAWTDDSWGGIRSSDLLERCRDEVSARTYGHEPDLHFPDAQEAATQITRSADGKRWDGWAARPDGSHLDFSCSYAAADGSVSAELIQEAP